LFKLIFAFPRKENNKGMDAFGISERHQRQIAASYEAIKSLRQSAENSQVLVEQARSMVRNVHALISQMPNREALMGISKVLDKGH
jgi:hypothetical protein